MRRDRESVVLRQRVHEVVQSKYGSHMCKTTSHVLIMHHRTLPLTRGASFYSISNRATCHQLLTPRP